MKEILWNKKKETEIAIQEMPCQGMLKACHLALQTPASWAIEEVWFLLDGVLANKMKGEGTHGLILGIGETTNILLFMVYLQNTDP